MSHNKCSHLFICFLIDSFIVIVFLTYDNRYFTKKKQNLTKTVRYFCKPRNVALSYSCLIHISVSVIF